MYDSNVRLCSAVGIRLCKATSCNYVLLFKHTICVNKILKTHPEEMLTNDSGPVLWDVAQLVPAVFPPKSSLIKFSGIDVGAAGCSIFHSRLRFLSHINQEWDWGAQIHRSRTYLWADNSAERKVLCSSKSTQHHRILVDAPLRWPSYCLNGFQAMMWNISFERGTYSNEDKVIKLPQLSLDLCFFLNYVWCKCGPHVSWIRSSREWCSFSAHKYWVAFFPLSCYFKTGTCQNLPSAIVST